MDYIQSLLSGLQRDSMPKLGTRVVGDSASGRPAYLNPDGSLSTERSVTVRNPAINGGAWSNIPTIFEGRHMPEDEASEYIAANQPQASSLLDMLKTFDPVTGREIPKHASLGAALRAAESQSAGMQIVPRAPWRSFWERGIR